MAKQLKVRCIDIKGGDASQYLILDKIYTVIGENANGADYKLGGVLHNGIAISFQKTRFVVISCQCGIVDCLTHRAKA
jgi:hypothetical protein